MSVFIRKMTVVMRISTNFKLQNSGVGVGSRMLQSGGVLSVRGGQFFRGVVRTLEDTMSFFPLGNSDHVHVSVSFDFL